VVVAAKTAFCRQHRGMERWRLWGIFTRILALYNPWKTILNPTTHPPLKRNPSQHYLTYPYTLEKRGAPCAKYSFVSLQARETLSPSTPAHRSHGAKALVGDCAALRAGCELRLDVLLVHVCICRHRTRLDTA